METKKTSTVFRPYRGPESNIQLIPYTNGYVYFATDSGKIYLDYNQERLPMGGNGASLFYASDESVKLNVYGQYEIDSTSIESKDAAQIKIDDLIINADGTFYKVLSNDTNSTGLIYCNRIAVSGSGGSSGGDSGGSSGVFVKLASNMDVPSTYVYGLEYNVSFTATSSDGKKINITATIDGNSDKKTINVGLVDSGVPFNIDIGSNLYKGMNSITITAVVDGSGATASLQYFTRQSIVLEIQQSKNFNAYGVFETSPVRFACASSVTSRNDDTTLVVYIDNNSHRFSLKNMPAGTDLIADLEISKHGIYQIRAVLETKINNDIVKSNELEYEIAFKEDDVNTPLIWFPKGYKKSIQQYEDYNIEYNVWSPDDEIIVHYYKSTEELANSPRTVQYNFNRGINWNISDYSIGGNSYMLYIYENGGFSRSITFKVEEDTVRNLEIITNGLVLNLDSTGRSNGENPSSRETWISKNGQATKVEFKDFNWYNNGWIADENGKSCMRISNGASLKIPLVGLNVLNSNKMSKSQAFEFRFKLRNVGEYSSLRTGLDSQGNPVFSTDKSVFCQLWNNGRGFCLGTQDAFFKTNVTITSQYREDVIMSLSFVIEPDLDGSNRLVYMYINGVLCGIAQYTSGDQSFNINASYLEFNSNYCDIDLYNVRIYNGYLLNSNDVVHNFLADKKNAKDYDINQILNDDATSIDFKKMVDYNALNPDRTLMPYMTIKVKDDAELPYSKGNKRAVKIEFHNPALDYAWEKGYITNEKYLQSAPSFYYYSNGKSLDVQGTSSQKYPRRNFKWKAKQDDMIWYYLSGPMKDEPITKWHLDSAVGEKVFCFKVDYMESSSSHNTGLATYLQELYTKHPLNDYGISTPDGVRTTIYGFPMIVFQEFGEGDSIRREFIGRYNFNLDKACEDTFGFTLDNNSKIKNNDGSYRKMSEVAECWELTNNQPAGRCSFRKVNFEETEAVDNSNDVGKLTVLGDFEPRYLEDVDDFENAANGEGNYASVSQATRNNAILTKMKNLEKMAKWLESTDTSKATNKVFETPIVIDAKTWDSDTREYRLAKFKSEFTQHFDLEYCLVYFVMSELLHLYDSRGKNCMLATWGPQEESSIEEIESGIKHYIWYPIFYDLDTQLGISNDGTPTWYYYTEATVENEFSTPNSVIWNNMYDVFLDLIENKYQEMRNNNLNFDNLNGYYNAYPIPDNSEIDSLRQIESTENPTELISKVVSYAKFGCRPEVIYNVDQRYKYIDPYTKGYRDMNGVWISSTDEYFYALQGKRDLARYLYLRNRINFYDSDWKAGDYDVNSASSFNLRYAANVISYVDKDGNTHAGTSDKYLVEGYIPDNFDTTGYEIIQDNEFPHPYDGTADFLGIKPFLQQYVTCQYDQGQTGRTIRYISEPVDLIAPQDKTDAVKGTLTQEQIVYIPGNEFISEVGDLSNKYVSEISMTSAKRLKKIILGNDKISVDNANEGYFNGLLIGDKLNIGGNKYIQGTEINPNAKTLLEEINLNGITSLNNTLDITGSEKLKIFKALNTGITAVSFADGVQLEILHLPKTITNLELIEPTELTGILDKPFDEEGKSQKGLYIHGITNATSFEDDKIALERYSVIGGTLGYDSYKLLEKLVKFKKYAIQVNGKDSKKNLAIKLEDVKWSPYETVSYGEEYSSKNSYYIDNGNFKLESYNYNKNTWEQSTLNGKIYKYIGNEYNIADLSILNDFIEDYESGLATGATNNFTNPDSQYNISIPKITGLIYVNNSVSYSEYELQNKYLKYFPELKIFVANVEPSYSAVYYNNIEGKENIFYTQREVIDGTEKKVKYPSDTPIRTNYDFIGWALSEDAAKEDILTQDYIENLVFSAENKVYRFYAIFKLHEYKFTFYNVVNNGNNTAIKDEQIGENIYIKAGETLYAPNIVPSTNEDLLDLEIRYTFFGYVDNLENCFPNSAEEARQRIVTFEEQISSMDRVFYACYVKENVYARATDNKYFTFETTTTYGNALNYVDKSDSSYDLNNICYIMPASGVKLSGKITIPSSSPDGKPVAGIKNFGSLDQANITHIFFMGAESIREISSESANEGKLKYFEFTPKLRIIGQNAFEKKYYLTNLSDLSNTAVRSIGTSAFNNSSKNITLIKELVLSEIESIGTNAFSNIITQNIDYLFEKIQLGSEKHPVRSDLFNTRGNLIDNLSGIFRQNTNIKELAINVEVYVSTGSDITEDYVSQWFTDNINNIIGLPRNISIIEV